MTQNVPYLWDQSSTPACDRFAPKNVRSGSVPHFYTFRLGKPALT